MAKGVNWVDVGRELQYTEKGHGHVLANRPFPEPITISPMLNPTTRDPIPTIRPQASPPSANGGFCFS